MNLGIAGRRALIASSGSGIGAASAVALAEEGVKVVIHGRSVDRQHRAGDGLPRAQSLGLSESGDALERRVARDVWPNAIRRLGRTQEIAPAACYLASEQAGFVTGSTLRVDGGMASAMKWWAAAVRLRPCGARGLPRRRAPPSGRCSRRAPTAAG